MNKIKVNPTTATTSLRAEYSIDGGGHWLLINNNGMANTSNEFILNNHRPTLIRFVNVAETDININSVQFYENESSSAKHLSTLPKL